eukprot:SAG31_NODE_42717_length_270_cov_0.719298_1_plen_33_part_01
MPAFHVLCPVNKRGGDEIRIADADAVHYTGFIP